jgi:triosephosphate isomerase (TIM)
MQKKIIIGNWKMNPSSVKEAEKLFGGVFKLTADIKKTEIVICPPFVYLGNLLKLSRKIKLGAQNVFYEAEGAFTGEISAKMLKNLGAKYVILGHSERRALGETNTDINKKVKAALSVALVPILCVGESLRDEKHEYFNFVRTQIEDCLSGVPKNLISRIILAYEPVWAISTTMNRRDATPADCEEMIIFIRKILADKFGKDASKVKIIYGGSVNDKDAAGFLETGGADGLLPGRASLDIKKFTKIIDICEKLNR